jgi:hypothetical protein
MKWHFRRAMFWYNSTFLAGIGCRARFISEAAMSVSAYRLISRLIRFLRIYWHITAGLSLTISRTFLETRIFTKNMLHP